MDEWIGLLDGAQKHLDDLLKLIAAIGGPIVAWVLTGQNRKRIKQEDDKHREEHTLELFRALSSQIPHLQLAAASVLIERLKRLNQEIKNRKPTEIDYSERASIQYALHLVLKGDFSGSGSLGTSAAGDGFSHLLAKYIGEQLVRLNDAQPLDKEGQPFELKRDTEVRYLERLAKPKYKESPLKGFDWQEIKIMQAWWPGIDAREIDFFRAELRECGMRFANLDGAKLYEASLCRTILRGARLVGTDIRNADLSEADLRDSDLTNANFSGTNLSGCTLSSARNWDKAIWRGASYSAKTALPDGFLPAQHEMKLTVAQKSDN